MELKVIRYEVSFKSNTNILYRGVYKSRKAIRRAKDRYDLAYGAYLSAEVTEVLENGEKRLGFY